jgi:hypothetical protein
MQVTVDARNLSKSWRIRLRTKRAISPDLVAEIESCLVELERAGRNAFNVYLAHYDEPPEPSVSKAVERLRTLGITSGTSHESPGPCCVHLWIDPHLCRPDS